jgi:hypothetical protein
VQITRRFPVADAEVRRALPFGLASWPPTIAASAARDESHRSFAEQRSPIESVHGTTAVAVQLVAVQFGVVFLRNFICCTGVAWIGTVSLNTAKFSATRFGAVESVRCGAVRFARVRSAPVGLGVV